MIGEGQVEDDWLDVDAGVAGSRVRESSEMASWGSVGSVICETERHNGDLDGHLSVEKKRDDCLTFFAVLVHELFEMSAGLEYFFFLQTRV